MISPEQASRFLQGLSRFASSTGVLRLFEWTRRSGLTILRMRLSPTSRDAAGDAWTAEMLTEALQLVAERYTVIPLRDAVAALEGRQAMPEAPLVLTASITTPPGDFPLGRVLSAAKVQCFISGSPTLLDRGQPPWPVLVRTALDRVSTDSVDFYERRWPIGGNGTREKVAKEIIGRLYALPDTERHSRAIELIGRWGVSADTVRGIQWTDFERLANTDGVTVGASGLIGDSLLRQPADRAIWELRESRYRMSDRLGREIVYLEYPWGEMNPLLGIEAKRAGYVCGIGWSTDSTAVLNPRDRDPFALISRPFYPGTREMTRAELAGLMTYLRPAVRFITRKRRKVAQ
ncbi:MAG TPA: hypothetical protein ENN56_01680 [Firmicutes bacterium]|nr:hypothetical protein [Bacillota bacterium]